MARPSKVVVRDLGYAKLRKRLVELGRPYVTVGVHQEDQERSDEDGTSAPTMVMIASVHEFGSSDGRVPERSYIRSAMDGNRQKIADLMARVEGKVADGNMSARNALGLVGEFCQAAIQRQITDLRDPPLSPATIEGRENGGDNPLIDTGQLRAAIRYDVQEGQRPKESE